MCHFNYHKICYITGILFLYSFVKNGQVVSGVITGLYYKNVMIVKDFGIVATFEMRTVLSRIHLRKDNLKSLDSIFI